MWELICDHHYRWGKIAGDSSPWQPASDGFPSAGVSTVPDGYGLRFPGPQSRIEIKPTKPWMTLGGIRVEITARIASYRPSRFLIDGDSFSMKLHHGLLIGAGTGRDVLNTYSSTLGPPLNKWTRYTFEHNSLTQMCLFIDDDLAATSGVINPVAGVGPKGVAIGNALASNNGYFDGDIERVRVWRIDPFAMKRQFLARPIDRATADCWVKFIHALRAALAANPDCGQWLVAALAEMTAKFRAALAQLAPDKLAAFNQFVQQYDALWRVGLIDDPAMKALLANFRDFLIKEKVVVLNDPMWKQLYENECMQALLKALPKMDCDPEMLAILRAIGGVDESKGGKAPPSSKRN
jgi:hypothetical protein